MVAHGVGIGSFVYLRRIFERLIGEAEAVAKTEAGWDAEAFKGMRMDDKIQMLAGHLPPFLVEHRRLYGILSKGVHALGEDECLEAFPAVRAAIEMMLDEKVNAKKVEDRKEAAKKSIAALEQKLATSGEAKPAENP